ncbi:MAG: TonB-dependent receptor, partial [Balneolaceae bacterium]
MDVKKLLFLISFLFISQSLFAQSGKIVGFITDTSGEPLPGVNIIIQGTDKGTASGVDGYYQILNVEPGTHNLRATYIGFAQVLIEGVEVNIGLTTEIDIEMREEAVEGEEINIIAMEPIVRKDVSSSQATISNEDIEALPVTSVANVIGLQAGVEGLSIRGSGTNEVSFNLNGFSLRSERSNIPFTGISVTSIENVQVQTGGFNAEYGDVRSGLINVTSREGQRDRYTLDGIVRYTPAQAKNIGQDVNDPNSYWLRPYLDDDVAWTGTSNGEWNENGEWTGGAWDSYTQDEYPSFEGWNAISQRTLADNDPNDLETYQNDLTPEAAQQAFIWQHRKDMAIQEPDYEIDLTLGGPVPFVSSKLGDLRFSTSFRETQTMYFIPLSEDRYKQTTFQTKVTSNVAPGMKFSVEGLYSKQTGTGERQDGAPGFFASPSGIAGSMNRVSFIDTRIFASDYWAPTEQVVANIGAQFTHTLNNSTFYEVKVNNFFENYSTNPGAYRDTSEVVNIGGVSFDEAPFGFYDASSEGIASGMRMGVGMSTSRDSSKLSTLTAKATITSQLDRYNEVKAGIEFIRTNSQINYGSFDKALQQGRTRSVWGTTPIRLSAFLQDKLEFGGMIANVGLRLTYSDPNIDWYDYEEYSNIFSSGAYSSLDTVSTSRVDPQIIVQPRLGVSFPITDNSKLFFNYGHFLQLPNPENLYLVEVEPFNDKIVRMAVPDNPI